MKNFIIFLDRLVNLYLYFIIGACILSWIPNINPNFPMFHYIFKAAGFYIIPPVMGMSFSPALVMLIAALISMSLRKLYNKLYPPVEKKIIILTPEEFMEKINKQKNQIETNKEIQNENEVDKNNGN
ncbi:YggT family protein [bacterium]|nr:YggT family protein [bacterium]